MLSAFSSSVLADGVGSDLGAQPQITDPKKQFSSSAAPRIAQLSILQMPDGQKIKIIQTVSANWRKVGQLLDFDSTGQQLQVIDSRERGDPEKCCLAMFRYWLEGNGKQPVSWNTLIEILEDGDFRNLAHEVKCATSHV